MAERDVVLKEEDQEVPPEYGREFVKHSIIQNTDMRLESGTCNVCAAPCSSCMHLNRALMGSKAEESSDENRRRGEANQYSTDDGDGSSLRSRVCERLKSCVNETSNIILVDSTHDSLSENADSRRALSNKYQESKCSEGFDDNASSTRRPSKIANGSHKTNDRITISYSSASISHLGAEGSGSGPSVDLPEILSSNDADILENLSECCMENVDSSLTKERAPIIVSGEESLADKDSPVIGTAKVSLDVLTKSGEDTDNVVRNAEDEYHKCSVHDGLHEKVGELVKSQSEREPHSEDESDTTSSVGDGKVCDICGDAGIEYKLVICSNCSDGAEHIYCMRQKLEKVPEGDWLCEECKYAEETENQRLDDEGEKHHKYSSTSQVSGKRSSERVEVRIAAKRQALETNRVSPKASSPKKMISLSRESSFKSLDKGKRDLGHQIPIRNNAGGSDIELARSLSAGPRNQPTKSTFLKSNSFNPTSKPRVKLVNGVPQKQKAGGEHTSKNMEAPAWMVKKSMSSISSNLRSSTSTESKVKMLSLKSETTQDLKGSRLAKKSGAFDRKLPSRIGRPVVSSTMTTSVGPNTKGEPKVTPCDVTAKPSAVNNIQESKVNQDVKLSSSSKSSSNISRKTLEAQVISERTSTKVDDTQQDGISRSQETTCSSKEDMHKGTDWNCEFTSKDQVLVSNTLKNSKSAEETNVKQEILENSTFETSKCLSANGLRQLNLCPTDFCSQLGKPDSFGPSHEKPVMRALPNQALEVSNVLPKMFAIPEYEYIWQGVFEVHRSGKPPDLYTGIQAHLSTCVSPKVLDAVNKFLPKVTLTEVSRLSSWPSQFHQGGAKENNIALYFFAKDIESYEHHYKGLLDHMIRNDLALKGILDGVEFLIFPSNQLPENSQRWNMLYFLWGVFKGSRSNHSDSVENICIPSLNVMPIEKDFPASVMILSEPRCSPKRMDEESIASGKACSALRPSTFLDQGHIMVCRNFDTEGIDTASNISKNKISERMNNDEDQGRPNRKQLEDDLNIDMEATFQGDLTVKEVNSQQPNDKKNQRTDLSDTVMQARAVTCQRIPWNEVNGKLEGGESFSKKLKTDTSESYGFGSTGSRDSFNDRFVSLTNNIGPCSSVEVKECKEVCDEKIIHEDFGTERVFFPMKESYEFDEDRFQVGIPNLNLALEDELEPSHSGTLPFFVGAAVNKISQEKLSDVVADEPVDNDSVAASLSLSLAFPSPHKEYIKTCFKS
ncbi:putative chromatin regulator PHD family [Lupinus albus]|uniref:Putative chromatin regulator PHD family n=1 Tax=Lupinus albus TaxID=3870 RepID=A0A6A4R2H2_LUPAL|nr:putative chromatin regulator PHD family [Lupinus albus]